MFECITLRYAVQQHEVIVIGDCMKKYELEVDIVRAIGKELWSTTAKNKKEAIEKLKNGDCDKEVLEMESETNEIDFNEIQEV